MSHRDCFAKIAALRLDKLQARWQYVALYGYQCLPLHMHASWAVQSQMATTSCMSRAVFHFLRQAGLQLMQPMTGCY